MKLAFATLVFASCLYLYFDWQLYVYGKSQVDVYQDLPKGIRPDDWGYDKGNLGFVLLDQYGMTILAPGGRYDGMPWHIAEVDSYGYNQQLIIAAVKDSSGIKRYVNIQPAGGDSISITEAANSGSSGNQLKWVHLRKAVPSLQTARNVCLLFVLVLAAALAVIFVRGRMRAASAH